MIDLKLKEKMKDKGYTILLKPTHDCNIHCTYCYDRIAQKTYGKGIMPFETIHKVVDMMNKDTRKCSTFIFHGGEPLLAGIEWYKYVLEYMKKNLKQKVMEYSMQSNGTLLSEEYIDLFKKYNVHVGISYDIYPEGVIGFRKNVDAKKLKALKEKYPTELNGAICVLTEKNRDYVEYILNKANSLGFKSFSLNFVYPTEEITMDESKIFYNFEDYANTIYRIVNHYKDKNTDYVFERGIFQLLSLINGGHFTCCNRSDCRYGWVGVGPTGKLANCDTYSYGPFDFGHINDYEAITDFHYTENYTNAVRARDNKREIMCSKCMFNDVCLGTCFSNSLNKERTAITTDANACNEIKYGMYGAYKAIRNINIMIENWGNNFISKFFIANDYYTPIEIRNVIFELYGLDYLKMEQNNFYSINLFYESNEYKIYRIVNPAVLNNLDKRKIAFNIDKNFNEFVDEKSIKNINNSGFDIKYIHQKRKEAIRETILENKEIIESLLCINK